MSCHVMSCHVMACLVNLHIYMFNQWRGAPQPGAPGLPASDPVVLSGSGGGRLERLQHCMRMHAP